MLPQIQNFQGCRYSFGTSIIMKRIKPVVTVRNKVSSHQALAHTNVFLKTINFLTMSTNTDLQQTLKDYLAEKNLNKLFVSIVESLLLERPDNVAAFIVSYLKENFPNDVEDHSESEERMHSESESEDSGSEIESENEEEIAKVQPRPVRRRASICAEKMCTKAASAEEIKKTPKSQEEMEKIHKILMQCVLFEHLDEKQLETVKEAMFPVEKNDGENIIQQGDNGDNFYVIETGNVNVYILNESGEQDLVNEYSDGDSFGELAIMYNAPRAATCIAKSDVKLWALDRTSFKLILMKSALEKRSQYKSFLKEIPLLHGISEHNLSVISDVLHEETLENDQTVFDEGVPGDRFYIVKTGGVLCRKKVDGEEKTVSRLGTGSYFGELALLSGKPRAATVVTTTDNTVLLSLDRNQFNRVLGPLRELLQQKKWKD